MRLSEQFAGRELATKSVRLLRAAAILALLIAFRPADLAAGDVTSERQKLNADYSNQLKSLAEWCDGKSLTRQADVTRAWLPKHEPATDYVFVLPDSSAAPKSLVDSPAAREWWDKFADLRKQQAEKLIELADAAIKNRQPALAFELVRETVRENPDHARGRAILGFQREGERWVSAETARRLRAGQVWSDKFGWLPADQLPRYERGMRFYRGRWIEAAEDDRLHSNIRNGWRVESDHFAVVTNYSLEEGVQLAARLEKLYDAWQQIFLTYYTSPAEVERWMARTPDTTPVRSASGKGEENDKAQSSSKTSSITGIRKPFEIVYFRNRQQYTDYLEQMEPQIGITLGYYSDRGKIGYFFADDKQYAGTLYHEATHQLFREMKPGSVDPGRKNNFWIAEGIACYMESFAEHQLVEGEPYGSYISAGGENAGRVPAARKRVAEHFYVPLRELAAMGMKDLQHDSRLGMLYSQSTGLALFLMQADAARYRPALIDYLTALYAGRASADTLEKLTGQRYEELDRQYLEFMK